MNLTRQRATIAAFFALLMLIILSSVFVFGTTFAGNPEAPDATATYTQNTLTWNTGVASNGSAKLNIFGEPEEGGDLAEVNPLSHGTYYLRLKNNVAGDINYTVYFYCENEAGIPLVFNVTQTEDMTAVGEGSQPNSIKDYELLSAYSGKLSGKDLKDFEISWKWDTESDLQDTKLGDTADDEDFTYIFHVMFIIEDNNTYGGSGTGGAGGGSYNGGGSRSGSTAVINAPDKTPDANDNNDKNADGYTNNGGAENHGSDSARLLHREYVYGYDEGDFRPEGDITRAEVTAIFARIISSYDESAITSTDTPFTDINPEAWYPRYISYLSKTGIINGYTDGSFKPFIPITRREFAVICTNYYEKYISKIKMTDVSFNDLDKSDWGYEFIGKGYSMGWLSGYPDGSYRGDRCITRAEVVTIMNRILGRIPDTEYIDSHKDRISQFTDLTDNAYWAYYEIYEAAVGHIIIKNDGEYWVD